MHLVQFLGFGSVGTITETVRLERHRVSGSAFRGRLFGESISLFGRLISPSNDGLFNYHDRHLFRTGTYGIVEVAENAPGVWV